MNEKHIWLSDQLHSQITQNKFGNKKIYQQFQNKMLLLPVFLLDNMFQILMTKF